MSRVLYRVLSHSGSAPLGVRALYSASPSLTTETVSHQLDVHPFEAVAGADAFNGFSAVNCLRSSTAAVASRLTQQTEFPLLPGTPFTVEGAVSVNPMKQPRLVIEPGPQSTIVFANEEWESLSGFCEHDLKGRNAMQMLTYPGTETQTAQKIRDALYFKTRVRVTVMHFTKDGMPFMMQLQLSPLLNKNGNVSHVLACVKHV